MSDTNFAMRPSRAKVWRSLHAGEPMGHAFAEWAYQTPRFPTGVKGSDLLNATAEIQRETMIVWFLANYVLAEGQYFGFSEAASGGAVNTAPVNTMPVNAGIEIVGFDRGPFFGGGRSLDLLKAEFKDSVREAALPEVAALFKGLWQPISGSSSVGPTSTTPKELKESLLAAIDDFADTVGKLPTDHGGIGHNRATGDTPGITEDEKEVVLRAAAETKLGVLSSDYSRATLAWETASPVLKRIGDVIASQLGNLCSNFTDALGKTLGIGVGLLVLGSLGFLIGLWTRAEAIAAMIELARQLSH